MNIIKKITVLLTASFLIFMAGFGCKKDAPPPTPTPVPTPTIVPHDEKIVYTFNGALYQIETDGKEKEELFPDSNSKWFPSVSPDGWYVAYWVFSGGAYNLWIGDFKKNISYQITFDSAGLEASTHNITINNSPSWTPDSEHIIYSRYGDIWKITRDGFNTEALTDTRNNISPAVSANHRLIYSKIEGSAYNLYVRALYGKHDTQLTSYTGEKAVSSFFSPDGKTVVYNLINKDTVNIYKFNIDSKT
ncbi:MAG TPA: hypothetical protein ENN55_04960, partial [Firmicutes bacterium]|nr:hypothetical protein [Bacillota bacterium]